MSRAWVCGRALRALLAALLLTASASSSHAQGADKIDSGELVNFAYAAILGTGAYRVGARDIYVFRVPLSWTQREAAVNSSVLKPGIKWLFPITMGLYNFSPNFDIEIPETDDIGTISFLPGIELHYPRESGWQLRPYAQYGAGYDRERSEWSQIYAAGIKGRYDIVPLGVDTLGVTYGHRLVLAGYSPEVGSKDSLGYFSAGMDIRWPQQWRFLDRNTFIGVSAYGNLYFDDAEFINIIEAPDTVKREFTLGLSIGGDPFYELMGVRWERMGIGFKFGPNIRALTLFTSFPF